MVDGQFTVYDIAEALDVCVETIRRWVRWVEETQPVLESPLPCYEKVNGIRLWDSTAQTIESFKLFRERLPTGAMAEWNALRIWGPEARRRSANKKL